MTITKEAAIAACDLIDAEYPPIVREGRVDSAVLTLRSFIEQSEAADRDAARYRWLKLSATPGQRPSADEMPLNYQPIRLRVETAVYSPSTWNSDIDRLIDAAIQSSRVGESQ